MMLTAAERVTYVMSHSLNCVGAVSWRCTQRHWLGIVRHGVGWV